MYCFQLYFNDDFVPDKRCIKISSENKLIFQKIVIYLSIESHFVGVHGPHELHRKEKQIEWRCIQFAFLPDAIHMAREHRQNAIQYLYLHFFITKFVMVLLTLTQKCHISQISNVQKVRHLEQPAPDG